MQFEVIDRCPVPKAIAAQVRVLKRDVPGARLNSAYRGDLAAGILKRLGKSTQAMLYRGWLRRLPGFNPANPPGFSTHELRSDGVAYRGPRGRPLRAWGCGMDWGPPDLVDDVIAAARRRGWSLFRPYSSGSERQHLNFKSKPKLRKPRRSLVRATRVSKAGAAFIAGFEGFRSGPYRDAVGVWTIGYGHTAGVRNTSPHITRAEGRKLLRDDLDRKYAPPVVALAKRLKLKLSQNQFDALVSAVYNLGPGILDQGRTMGDALRSKNRRRIADAFLVYDKAGSPPRALPGLTRRRKAERSLFLKS